MMKITSAILLVAVLLVSTTESFSPTVTVRKQISGLTKDNFDATLKEIEPFLTKDAGASFYAKSMRRIAVQANAMGATIPTDYAKEAKATAKRREKQKTFIEAKQEEAAAAVAEAAAAAAEAAAAVEEETPAEEETAAEEEAPAE